MAVSPSGCLFVGDLSVCCRENHLRELFQEFGQVLKTEIKQGQKAFKLLGYGFVTLPSYVEAEAAMNSLNGKLVLGRRLRINWANNTGNHKEIICAEVAFSFISKQLNYMVYEQTIRELFSQYNCEVVDVAIKQYKIDQGSNKQSGIGFVHFPLTPEGVLAAKSAVYMLRNVCIKDVMYDCEVSKKLQAILRNHPQLDSLAGHIDLSTPETSLLTSGALGPDGNYIPGGNPLVPNLNSSSAKGKVSAKPIDIGFDLPYVPLYWFEHMLQYSLDEHLTPQQQAQLAVQVQSQLGPQPGYRQSSMYGNQHMRPMNQPLSPRFQQQQQQQFYRGNGNRSQQTFQQQQYGGGQSSYYYYDSYGQSNSPQQAQQQMVPTFYDPVTGNYFLSPTSSSTLIQQQPQQDVYYYNENGMLGDGLLDEQPMNFYDDYAQNITRGQGLQSPVYNDSVYQSHSSYGAPVQLGSTTPPPPQSIASPTLSVESRSIAPVVIGAPVDEKSVSEAVSSSESISTNVNASINVSLQDINLLSEEQLSATGLTATAPVFKMKTPFPPLPSNHSLSTSPVPSVGGGGITPPSVMYGSDFSYSNVNSVGLNNSAANAMLLFGGSSIVGGNRNRTTSTSSNTSVASSITTTSLNNVNPAAVTPSLSGASAPLPPLLCRSVSDTGYTRLLHPSAGNNVPNTLGGNGVTMSQDHLGDLLLNKSYYSSSSLMSLDNPNAVNTNPSNSSLLFSNAGGGLGGWTSGSQPTSSRILSTLNSSNNNNNVTTAPGSSMLNSDNTVLLPEFDLSLDFGATTLSGGDKSPFSLAVGGNTFNGIDKIRTSSDFTDRSRLNSNNSLDVNELLGPNVNSTSKIQSVVVGSEQQ